MVDKAWVDLRFFRKLVLRDGQTHIHILCIVEGWQDMLRGVDKTYLTVYMSCSLSHDTSWFVHIHNVLPLIAITDDLLGQHTSLSLYLFLYLPINSIPADVAVLGCLSQPQDTSSGLSSPYIGDCHGLGKPGSLDDAVFVIFARFLCQFLVQCSLHLLVLLDPETQGDTQGSKVGQIYIL